MIPFYNTLERRAALVIEAHSWLGTPFSENAAVKGRDGGVSCARYLAACHVAAGAIAAVTLPVLPVEQVRHWHEHHSESMILDWLALPEVRGRVRRVDDGEAPMVGDLVVMRVQLTEHHVGLWCGHEILHVAISAGVVSHSTRDPELMRLVRCFYRILA